MTCALDLTGEAFHHTRGDVEALHRLAALLPEHPVIVNIGACFGTSAMALLEARPDAVIFSIDVRACPEEADNLRRAGLDAGRVIRVLGRSQDAGACWIYDVDMVFVDGSHAYADVREDVQVWQPLLAPGGILAFHDYGTPSLPSVKRAVDDMMNGIEPLLHAETLRAYRL